jgi:hypothetical protein
MTARNLMLAVIVMVLSIGHVACSGLPLAAFSSPAQASSDSHTHSHRSSSLAHAKHEGGGSDHKAPCDPSDGSCSHCASAQLAASNAKVAQPATLTMAPVAIPAVEAESLIAAQAIRWMSERLRWAAPPGSTPVSLKVRLLN